jgi:hypothetical protein
MAERSVPTTENKLVPFGLASLREYFDPGSHWVFGERSDVALFGTKNGRR